MKEIHFYIVSGHAFKRDYSMSKKGFDTTGKEGRRKVSTHGRRQVEDGGGRRNQKAQQREVRVQS